MSRTKMFRDQHESLLEVVGALGKLLNVNGLSNDPESARSLLSTLSGKINVHLTMEDKSLYPRLLEHDNEQVRTMAKSFQDEMGTIKTVYSEFVSHWPTPKTIQENPQGFIDETNQIFSALGDRISREDNQLYEMADKS